mmetsp:Transcript_98396/g.273699  ORF Transcript_98396/g.273699 Transcript_98396/m.273699 type:complete len:246 (-) Transcript_98396:814-1551(-)
MEPVRLWSATTQPFGKMCSDPCSTACDHCCTARSGTNRVSLVRCPRSCTMRPEVVPTTTQPTSARWDVGPRHSLFTATDSTVSRLPCSQSLEISQVRLDLLPRTGPLGRAAAAAEGEAAFAEPWRGHSTRLMPCVRRTRARQRSGEVPSSQTTLMSFSACPSSAVHGGACRKRTEATLIGTAPVPPRSALGCAVGSCSMKSCPAYMPKSSATTNCFPCSPLLNALGWKPEWLGQVASISSPSGKS